MSSKAEGQLIRLKRLTKFKVNVVVGFTAGIGYVLSSPVDFEWTKLLWLFAGGFLITATAHILNQILERPFDAQMDRTRNRPLANGSMKAQTAFWLACLSGSSGWLMLYFFVHPASAEMALLSLIVYTLIYTPLKRLTPWAVLLGAVPGALPLIIGYVAGGKSVDMYILSLFFLQLVWQLPHFWSVAWIYRADYAKAGYRFVPYGGTRPKALARLVLLSSVLLIPAIGILARFHRHYITMGIIWMLTFGLILMATLFARRPEPKFGKMMMRLSVAYLPAVLMLLLLNKLINHAIL